MHISEESASVTFDPQTGFFKADLSTNNIILCLAVIFIAGISWHIIKNLSTFGIAGYIILFFLFIPFIRIIWGITASMFIKADKTLKVVGISSDLLTKEAISNLLGYFVKHPLKDILQLPEPDAKYDPTQNKKVPFSNKEEKEKVLKEQEKVVEEAAEDIKAITEKPINQIGDNKTDIN